MSFNFLFLILTLFPVQKEKNILYESESLIIKKITENTYQHISYIYMSGFGKVECNGIIFRNGRESIIIDSPVTYEASREMMRWLKDVNRLKINGVVATHFHRDCVGGLEAFHTKVIQSYGQQLTITLGKTTKYPVPMNVVDRDHIFRVGKADVRFYFPGEGHSRDNMVIHIPSENLLYGGCLVKSLGADVGYTGDANLDQWSQSVQKVKDTHPDLKVVVPGHGNWGGTELLDYTIQLFEN